MGRRQNPVIAEFFDRGAKLKDNSNRYQYQCKACGEDFPKGRTEMLIAHISKKCPAVSRQDRLDVVLSMSGLKDGGSGRHKYDGLLHSEPNTGPNRGPNGAFEMSLNSNPMDDSSHLYGHDDRLDSLAHPLAQPQNAVWNPLETLAEASRQLEAHGKHDVDVQAAAHDATTEAVQSTLAAAVTSSTASAPTGLLLHDRMSHDFNTATNHVQRDATVEGSHDLITDEGIDQLLEPSSSPSRTAVDFAAAATARLTTSLLDPQLVITKAAITEHMAQAAAQAASSNMMIDCHEPGKAPGVPSSPMSGAEGATNWGGMAYATDEINAPATVSDQTQRMNSSLNKGGFRMHTLASPGKAQQLHSRASFSKDRRKQVQEVRRRGACIRCRILRKSCSTGTPCDTCRKVLAPRVWHTGCFRAKLEQLIDLYSANVQVLLSQKRIKEYKESYRLQNNGVLVEASHFPETGETVTFQALQGYPKGGEMIPIGPESPVLLLDPKEPDISPKVEGYMRRILPEYIARERTPFVRVTLETADRIAKESNDELLKRSLELWAIVEMMDRERQWIMVIKAPYVDFEEKRIKEESEAYSNICTQLTAAAERKASVASKDLLGAIQRKLADGKAKLGFPMFLTIMLFLNCLEKTTWAFTAWNQENLRPKWPLETPPGDYLNQGQRLTELLRGLMSIRKALPEIYQLGFDDPILVGDDDPVVVKYFRDLDITPAYLASRCDGNTFEPTDSRSLEFMFCSPFLLEVKYPATDVMATPGATTPSADGTNQHHVAKSPVVSEEDAMKGTPGETCRDA